MFHVEQLVLSLKFEEQENVAVIEKGIKESFNDKRVEIIQPLPLDDLIHMMDAISEGYESEKANKLDSLGRGAFGTVLGYKDYAIKYFRNGKSQWDSASTENKLPDGNKLTDAYILKELQSIPSIPRIYAVIDDRAIIMERIDGDTCEDYADNVRNSKYKKNYISKDFNNVYRNALVEIANLGFEPYDLHGHNVMVCRKTGLPKIVDVGLFRKITSEELMKEYQSNEKFEITPMRQAISWVADSMNQYIERKTNPKKWKEIDLQNEIRQAEREAYREKENREREERLKKEMEKQRKENEGRERQYIHRHDMKKWVRKDRNNPQFTNLVYL